MLGKPAKGLTRASSDNHGHADWLSMKEAKKLFPGPDPEFGGIVVGEAYRVDQDRVASGPFDPSNQRSWGQGGSAPLLIDPCRSGSTLCAGHRGLRRLQDDFGRRADDADLDRPPLLCSIPRARLGQWCTRRASGWATAS